MDKQTSDILETMANFSNELSIEDARAELTVSMHTLTAQSIHDAKARAQAAEKELADISGLLAMEGKTKTVKLVHDEFGKTVGAVVTERAH